MAVGKWNVALIVLTLVCTLLAQSNEYDHFIDYPSVQNGPWGSCDKKQFRCFSGKCIQKNWFCDGANDCEDNSDEKFCDFNANSYTCPSEWNVCANKRRCHPSAWKCDGYTDCPDGSDETECRMLSRSKNVTSLPGVIDTLKRLTDWFLMRRKNGATTDKWGHELHRTATVLYLANKRFFSASNVTGQEIAYELSLQLLSRLTMKKKISNHEMALFVNALLVACINPRDFYGQDLVADLRARIDHANYTNPFELLALCNADREALTQADVGKVVASFRSQHRPIWTDNQALAVMALSCMSSNLNLNVDDSLLGEMVQDLIKRQQKNGTVDNIKTTALVLQALLASNRDQKGFDLAASVKFLVNSNNFFYNFQGPFLEAYYILPALSSKSLANISNRHCTKPAKTGSELMKQLQDSSVERIDVQYSVTFGDEMDFGRTWRLKIPVNNSFYYVMETVGKLDIGYDVKYSVKEGKPYVRAVHKTEDDAGSGFYWFTYKKSSGEGESRLLEESPVDIKVQENDELILWYKSGDWAAESAA